MASPVWRKTVYIGDELRVLRVVFYALAREPFSVSWRRQWLYGVAIMQCYAFMHYDSVRNIWNHTFEAPFFLEIETSRARACPKTITITVSDSHSGSHRHSVSCRRRAKTCQSQNQRRLRLLQSLQNIKIRPGSIQPCPLLRRSLGLGVLQLVTWTALRHRRAVGCLRLCSIPALWIWAL